MRRIALAGTPNSGKTTLFNRLLGGREKVGNWPGTTVERKEGRLRVGDKDFLLVDLPGTYSLTAYSSDEQIASHFLSKEKPDCVVAVIDASNLERNLYFVIQLLELGMKTILVLNMMDLAKKHQVSIKTQELAQVLGIPVIETIASQGQGVNQLKVELSKLSTSDQKPLQISCGELEEDIQEATRIFDEKGKDLSCSSRALAVKMLEGDVNFFIEIKHSDYYSRLRDLKAEIHKKHSRDLDLIIMESRHAFIKGLVKECLGHQMTLAERLTLSDRVDDIVTNRFLGIPIFLMLMYLLFTFVFKVGAPMVHGIEKMFGALGVFLANQITTWGGPAWMSSFISDGVISGVGSVISFVPYIGLLFVGIAILEDSGYLVRAAFVMDRLMHALGLHGKSFIPMLIGIGCTVPGIMATRILNSEKDRLITILVLPLISCSARLPVYTLFAAAFFQHHQGAVVFSLYFLGIVLAVVMARIFRSFFFKGESVPLIIELPPYRFPTMRNVFFHMWLRVFMFIKKAGTLIMLAVVSIWALASLPLGVAYASQASLIGRLGTCLAPVFKPAGFGFWQAAVALLSGIFAKEAVIGTLGTLWGVDDSGLRNVLMQHFTPLSAYAFLVMTVIYIPCLATIFTIKAETNGKWALLAVCYTLFLGWLASVFVYQVGRLVF